MIAPAAIRLQMLAPLRDTLCLAANDLVFHRLFLFLYVTVISKSIANSIFYCWGVFVIKVPLSQSWKRGAILLNVHVTLPSKEVRGSCPHRNY